MESRATADYLAPKMVTIIITRKCTISCPMCFFGCSPKRDEVISEGLALEAVDQIHDLNVDTVGITGGEPFLEFELMRKIVARVASYGMTAIVVTNGHWAATEPIALTRLGALREVGLSWIQISLDDQHQATIPHDRVCNTLKAARLLNFSDIKLIGSSRGNSESFKYHLFYLQEVLGLKIDELDLLDRPRISHRDYNDGDQTRFPVADFIKLAPHLLPRPDCLNEMMIDVNGDVYPCCNNFVGRIGTLATHAFKAILARSKENQFCKLIGTGGPVALALALDKKFNTKYCDSEYSSWCEVCARMFQDESLKELLSQ